MNAGGCGTLFCFTDFGYQWYIFRVSYSLDFITANTIIYTHAYRRKIYTYIVCWSSERIIRMCHPSLSSILSTSSWGRANRKRNIINSIKNVMRSVKLLELFVVLFLFCQYVDFACTQVHFEKRKWDKKVENHTVFFLFSHCTNVIKIIIMARNAESQLIFPFLCQRKQEMQTEYDWHAFALCVRVCFSAFTYWR